MGHEGVLLGQNSPAPALLAVEKPVSKVILKFAAPGSAIFEFATDGQVMAVQLLALVARLARIDRRLFTANQGTSSDDPDTLSQLTAVFTAPGSAEFELNTDGRVTVGQIDAVEYWLRWKTSMDFTLAFQANMQQAARNQQIMGQIGQRGLGKVQ